MTTAERMARAAEIAVRLRDSLEAGDPDCDAEPDHEELERLLEELGLGAVVEYFSLAMI